MRRLRVPKFKRGQILEVTWEDAYGGTKWDTTEGEFDSLIVKNVGYFLSMSKKGLAIAGGYQVNNTGMGNALHFVPKGMIRKIKVIRG